MKKLSLQLLPRSGTEIKTDHTSPEILLKWVLHSDWFEKFSPCHILINLINVLLKPGINYQILLKPTISHDIKKTQK